MLLGFLLISLILLPKIGIIDLTVLPLLLYSMYLILKKKRLIFPKFLLGVLFIWLLIFILALVTYLYHGTVSTEVIFKPLRQIILILLLTYAFLYSKYSIDDIFKFILVASIINSIVVVVQYILHVTGISGDFLMIGGFVEEINVVFRKPGLFSGYPPAGMLAVIGMVISFYFLKYKYSTIYLLTLLISLAALMLTSRMALMIGFLFLFVLIPSTILKGKKQFFSLMSIPLIVGLSLFYLIHYEILHHDTIGVMFEIIINLMNDEGLKSHSGEALIDSYLENSPQYISTILIGNGLNTKSDIGLTIDSGIQITLFNAGLIALFLYHLIFILLYIQTVYLTKLYKKYLLFVSLLFALILISNLKGGFLFGRITGDALLAIIIGMTILNYKSIYLK